MKGTCVRFDRVKRYGFLAPTDETLPDHFVLARDILGPKSQHFLFVGQPVEFDSVDAEIDRPTAKNVRKFPLAIAAQYGGPAPSVFTENALTVPDLPKPQNENQRVHREHPSSGGVK
jgi:cold shock CspA family protein